MEEGREEEKGEGGRRGERWKKEEGEGIGGEVR